MAMVTEAAELWAAVRVVEMHATGGTCGKCEPDGSCRLQGWADARLRRWETEHGHRYLPKELAPGWHTIGDLPLRSTLRRGGDR
jgi:hypothetical protein